MSQTTIVIPCYNEAERLQVEEFRSFAERTRNVRFLFVDDGSTDGTADVLDGLHGLDPEAFGVCRLKANRGKAEAVRQGFLKAFESSPDYVGFWDADLATPLGAIPDFCGLLDGKPEIEMVFGSRVQLLGRSIERNVVRHYLGRLFATVVSCLLSVRIYDTQCGAKLFRVSPQIMALFQEPFITGWIFDVEIIARLIRDRKGTSLPQVEDIIYENPLQEWRDVEGSKISAGAFLKATFEIVRIYRTYLRSR